MVSSRLTQSRPARGIRLVLVAALGLLMLLPTGAVATPGSPSAHAAVSATPATGSFAATVTWNGANINTAGNAASALTIDFSQSANVRFNWTGVPSGGGANPNDARLQMFYFGFALATRDVVNTGSQAVTSLVLNWTPGALVYVLEGVYRITASLIDPNGSSVWSENFFVRANAPFSILAALPIILIALIIWELYSVARSGRQALLGRKGKPPSTPSTPPPEATPTEPTTAAAGETPPSGPEGPQ